MKKLIFIIIITNLYAFNLIAQNIGIGTTTPMDKLSVVNILPGYGISHTYGSITLGTYISNLNAQFGTKTNTALQFFTNNGNAQMELLTNGNIGLGISGGKIGIGNSNPTLGLDIGTRIRLREENYHEGFDHISSFSIAGLVSIIPILPIITVELQSNFVQRALFIQDGIQGEKIIIHCVKGNIIVLDAGVQLVPGWFSNIKLRSAGFTLHSQQSIELIYMNGIWSEI